MTDQLRPPFTDESLLAANRRLLERRADLARAKRAAPPVEPFAVGSTSVSGACACGATVTAEIPTLGGRSIVPRWTPVCSDCRRREDEAAADRAATRKAEQRAKYRDANLAALAVPPLYTTATLDSFALHGDAAARKIQAERLEWARGFVANWPHVGLLYAFVGGPGTGKGHLAYGIARVLIDRDPLTRVRVVKLPAVIRDLRASWAKGYDGPSDEKRLAAYLWPDLLVLDEVSRHAFYGQNIHQHLYDVLDARLEAMRPTILTTNETDTALRELLREALTNRLEGEGGIVEFGTASYRTRSEGGR